MRKVAECPRAPLSARPCPSASLQKSICEVRPCKSLKPSFRFKRNMREPTRTKKTGLWSKCCCGNGRCEQTNVLWCIVRMCACGFSKVAVNWHVFMMQKDQTTTDATFGPRWRMCLMNSLCRPKRCKLLRIHSRPHSCRSSMKSLSQGAGEIASSC